VKQDRNKPVFTAPSTRIKNDEKFSLGLPLSVTSALRLLIRLYFRRPVAVGSVTALLVVLSTVAYVRLPVALLSDFGDPALTVWTAHSAVPPSEWCKR